MGMTPQAKSMAEGGKVPEHVCPSPVPGRTHSEKGFSSSAGLSSQQSGKWVRANFKPRACEMGVGERGNLFTVYSAEMKGLTRFFISAPLSKHSIFKNRFLHIRTAGAPHCPCGTQKWTWSLSPLRNMMTAALPRQLYMKLGSKELCKIKDRLREIKQAPFCTSLKPKF